jgi:ABC-type branched-subunit amino acid transport system permease subunit
MRRYISESVLFLVLAALVSYPYIVGKFHVYLMTEIIIFSIFCVSFYLLLGHTGLLSFGHAAYFGLGAYCTILLLVHFPHISIFIAIIAGGILGLLGGLIIGLMLLRLTRVYFSLATVAFGQMMWAIAWKWRSMTGGDDGLVLRSGRKVFIPLLGHFELSNPLFLYYLILVISSASVLFCWLFTKTPLGNTLASLKSNANRTQFLGVNIYLAKLMLFGFSGFFAGISGSLYILLERMVSPGLLDMFMSFDVIIMSVLGGYSNFVGPVIGSFIYVYLVEYLSSFTDKWQLILGAIFIALILFCPNGLVGILKSSIIKRSMR